jgi:hypothetical protein
MKTDRKIYEELGEGNGFLLTDYTNDYESYVKNQKYLNEKKFNSMPGCNDSKDIFKKIRDEVLNRNQNPTFGLCHGVRSGLENKILGELLNCKVIGTEIGDKFGYPEITIQWDMHEIKDEWLGACDVIYSNALDHSYDPIYCLNQWAKTLKPTGMIVLQHGISGGHYIPKSLSDKKYSPGDPFNAPISIYEEICKNYTPLKVSEIKRWSNSSSDVHLLIELK